MRVTWLTDLHLSFLDDQRLAGFLETVTREQTDLLLVGGDTAESASLLGFIGALRRIAPVYFVLGNHDFYGASIAEVREQSRVTQRWLPSAGPIRLTSATTLVGIDGWGDARCGDLRSRIELSDWRWIRDLQGLTSSQRGDALRALGTQEAAALNAQLAGLEPPEELLVLTHVPPFAESCWHNGRLSEPAWLPWFTCIAVGEVLLDYARRHPMTNVTVLCGHTHGRGEYRALANLLVRTGGWPPGEPDYGHPIVQATWSVR